MSQLPPIRCCNANHSPCEARVIQDHDPATGAVRLRLCVAYFGEIYNLYSSTFEPQAAADLGAQLIARALRLGATPPAPLVIPE